MKGRLRLLVVRLSSLGDVVLSTGVLSSLGEVRPRPEIFFLTHPRYRALVEHHPAVTEVLHPPEGVRRAWDWFRFGLSLRSRRFDAVVDLQYNWRTMALKAALVPVRSRHWKSSNLARRNRMRNHGAAPVEPMVERLQHAVLPWTGGRIAAPLVVGGLETREQAHDWLSARGGEPGSWLGVVPVAHWATKRWAPERYAELCARWVDSQAGRRAAAFFGPGDLGTKVEFVRAVGPRAAIHLVELPLGPAAEVLRLMDAVVAGDTGLMHLAAALRVRTLALFGPTSPDFGVAPCGPGNRSVGLDLACRPCSLHGQAACPLGHHRCMKDLSVDRVWKELEIMRGAGSPASVS